MPSPLEWAERRVFELGQEIDRLTLEIGTASATKAQQKSLKSLTNQLTYAKTLLETEEAVRQKREELQLLADAEPLQADDEKDLWIRKRLARYPMIRQGTLRELISTWTKEGQDIAKVMLAILYDDPLRLPERAETDEPINSWPRNRSPNITERMAAADWLATRLWGRPVVVAKVETSERKQLELVWGDAGLPERDSLPEDEKLIEPIEAEFKVSENGNAESRSPSLALRTARRRSE